MAKKRKKNKMPYYIASAMTVLAAASVGLVFYSGGLNPNKAPEQETTPQSQIVAEASDGFVQKRAQVDYPMMPTDIENVFVSANPYGKFAFYDYADGTFTPCNDMQTMDIKVTCSHQEIPTTLYYLERDGKKTGYGLFLTILYEDDVRLYNYAFFRLLSMPQGYGSGDAMLLVDFDEMDFARQDKTYSEVFSFDMATGKSQLLTSNNGRTVDQYGRLRPDWAMMNDAIYALGGQKIYLSGRNYQIKDNLADLIVNLDTSNTKPTWISTGIYKNFMHTENGTMYYVKPTEQGFDLYAMTADGTETKKGAFVGSVEDYLFKGDYMLDKNTLALTCLSTGENKGTAKRGSVMNAATDFSVSPDGKKAVILCDGEKQAAILMDIAAGTCKECADTGLFTNVCDQGVWVSADSFFTTVQTETGYEVLVWKD